MIVPVSRYPPSERRLIQSVYDRMYSANVQHMKHCSCTASMWGRTRRLLVVGWVQEVELQESDLLQYETHQGAVLELD